MRIIYLLLSPTYGMHQYTADLANHQADQGHDVHLVTTVRAPRPPYAPAVHIHTPVDTTTTGFARDGLRPAGPRRVLAAIDAITRTAPQPTVVHITGVHLWNPLLLRGLRRRGLPTIHTLHDLDPHLGVRFSRLIRLWNRSVLAGADRILVHGQVYRQRLLQAGLPAARVVYTPLLHLFLSHAAFAATPLDKLQYDPYALFFGRLLAYKGVNQLMQAATLAAENGEPLAIVLAGPGEPPSYLPSGVELRNHLIDDHEGWDLFQRCAVVVLPYLDATQSALIAAAYYFAKPVIVSNSGALPEYVQPGHTGWVIPVGDVSALAAALQQALADPQRTREMGLAGRAWYLAQRHEEQQTLAALYRATGAGRRSAGL